MLLPRTNSKMSGRSAMLGKAEGREVLLTEEQSEIPYPWQLLFDDELQAHYYFNPLTEETRWADVDEGHEEEGEYEYAEHDGSVYLDELDGDNSVSNVSRMSSMSVVDRSAQMLAQKKEREEALRLEMMRREEQEMRSVPEINKRSKQMNRKVDDMFTWEQQRKERAAALAEQQRAEEAGHNPGRPTLYANHVSSSASVSSGGSNATPSSLPVEERLLAFEEKRRLKLQQTRAQEVNDARKAATPTISAHSANLARRRLSTGYEPSPRVALTPSDVPGILRDGATGQLLFQPKLNKRSEQMVAGSRPAMPIEDILTGKGHLQKQRLAEREQRVQQRDKALSSVSKVNPKSAKIVQDRYILQGETTQDRLHYKTGNVKQKTLEEIEKPTFKPTLNPVSLEIANAATGVHLHYSAQEYGGNNSFEYSPEQASFERFHSGYGQEFDSHDGPLLYEDLVKSSGHSRGGYSTQGVSAQDAMYQKTQKWNEARQQRLDKERKERERKEKEVCTFKPKIDATARASIDDVEQTNNSIDSYLQRQSSWVERREQKLEMERRRAAEKELEGCSFVPALRGGAASAGQPGAKSGAGTPAGAGRTMASSGKSVAAPGGSTRMPSEQTFYVSGGAEDDAYDKSAAEIDIDQQMRDYYGTRQERGYQQVEEESAPAAGGRIPLPAKAVVRQPQKVSSQATSYRHPSGDSAPAPSTVSISVPLPAQSGDGDYYVDYVPSPSSGVMLARTAQAEPPHAALQFSSQWNHESSPPQQRYAQHQHHHEQPVELAEPDDGGAYEYEATESDSPDAMYSGLPVSSTPYAQANTSAAGVSKALFASPPYGAWERAVAPSVPYAKQEPSVSAHRQPGYSYGAFVEPDEADYGGMSLFDLQQPSPVPIATNRAGAGMESIVQGNNGGSNRALRAPHYEDESPPPPPPVPSALHRNAHQVNYAHDHAAAHRSVTFQDEPPPAPGNHGTSHHTYSGEYEDQDYENEGEGVEFSPSPVKAPNSRSAMYDML